MRFCRSSMKQWATKRISHFPSCSQLVVVAVHSVSAGFQWTAQQVAKLGRSKQPIYILPRDKLKGLSSGEISASASLLYKVALDMLNMEAIIVHL